MKRKLLKCLSCLFMFMSLMVGFTAHASNQTGHDEFDMITVPDGSDTKLLVWMSQAEKKAAIKNVKFRWFGVSANNVNYRKKVNYQAKTIFARSNLTSSAINFDYSMQTGRTVTNSVATSGTLDLKLSTKIKAITLSGGLTFKAEWQKKVEVEENEKMNFTVCIYPKTKVSLIVKGVAEVTNGGAKYYVLGIPFKSGNFEFIDVVTEYYELLEEAL